MPNADSPWRPEFLDALRMLARLSEALARRGLPRPVLVGGGAVEFYTGSAVMTPILRQAQDRHRRDFAGPAGA